MKGCLDFLDFVYKRFGFTFKLFLSTRPEKFLGDVEVWTHAEKVCCPTCLSFTKPAIYLKLRTVLLLVCNTTAITHNLH